MLAETDIPEADQPEVQGSRDGCRRPAASGQGTLDIWQTFPASCMHEPLPRMNSRDWVRLGAVIRGKEGSWGRINAEEAYLARLWGAGVEVQDTLALR